MIKDPLNYEEQASLKKGTRWCSVSNDSQPVIIKSAGWFDIKRRG